MLDHPVVVVSAAGSSAEGLRAPQSRRVGSQTRILLVPHCRNWQFGPGLLGAPVRGRSRVASRLSVHRSVCAIPFLISPHESYGAVTRPAQRAQSAGRRRIGRSQGGTGRGVDHLLPGNADAQHALARTSPRRPCARPGCRERDTHRCSGKRLKQSKSEPAVPCVTRRARDAAHRGLQASRYLRFQLTACCQETSAGSAEIPDTPLPLYVANPGPCCRG
jgi:hypothetical protein